MLELDTTAPQIDVLGISYSQIGVIYHVTITANEPLDKYYQDVTAHDADGNSIVINMQPNSDGTIFEGVTQFIGLNSGMIIITAIMRDEVNNVSNIAELPVLLIAKLDVCCKLNTEQYQNIGLRLEEYGNVNMTITTPIKVTFATNCS